MKLRLKKTKSSNKDHLLIGISSVSEDFMLAHFLNKHFQTSFIKQKDIPFYNTKGLLGHFHFHSFYNPDLRVEYYLFSNKNNNSVVFPKYRHFEYFILFAHSTFSIPIEAILKELWTISVINAAIKIPIETIKNLDDVLEDIEIHLLEINSKQNKKKAPHWLW